MLSPVPIKKEEMDEFSLDNDVEDIEKYLDSLNNVQNDNDDDDDEEEDEYDDSMEDDEEGGEEKSNVRKTTKGKTHNNGITFSIQGSTFKKLVYETILSLDEEHHDKTISNEALMLLREHSEDYIIDLFRKGSFLIDVYNKKTLTEKDFKVILEMSKTNC